MRVADEFRVSHSYINRGRSDNPRVNASTSVRIPNPPFKLALASSHPHRTDESNEPYNENLSQTIGSMYPGSADHDEKPFPADLQIRRCSSLGLSVLMYTWYFFCITAFSIIWIPSLRWGMYSICGPQFSVSVVGSMTGWNSTACLSVPDTSISAATGGSGGLVWQSISPLPTQRDIYQYRRFVVHIPRPPDKFLKGKSKEISFDVQLVIAPTNSEGQLISDSVMSPIHSAFATVATDCSSSSSWCNILIVPDGTKNLGEHSVVRFQLEGLSQELQEWFFTSVGSDGIAPVHSIAVGIAYQHSGYTLTLLVCRYVLLTFCILRLLLFIGLLRWSHMTQEQLGILFIQVGLILYLNPLAALCVVTRPTEPALAFVELHLPYYYFTLLTLFVIFVMISALPWEINDKDEKRKNEARGYFSRIYWSFKQYWFEVRTPYTAPRWVTFLYIIALFSVIVIDVVELVCFNRVEFWAVNAPTKYSSHVLTWIIQSLIMLCCIASLVVYFFLPQYFVYIVIRARWLGVHMLMRIFAPLVLIVLAEIIAFNFYDPNIAPPIQCDQPFVTLSSVLVSAAFVHAMLSVYMGTRRSPDLPVDAADHRWKTMVWPEQWIAWIRIHGNGQYIFYSEREERVFCELQKKYRKSGPDGKEAPIFAGPVGYDPYEEEEKRNHESSVRVSPMNEIGLSAVGHRNSTIEPVSVQSSTPLQDFHRNTDPTCPLPIFLAQERQEPSNDSFVCHPGETLVDQYRISTLDGPRGRVAYGQDDAPVVDILLNDDPQSKMDAERLKFFPSASNSYSCWSIFSLVVYHFFHFLRQKLFALSNMWWQLCAPSAKETQDELGTQDAEERYRWDIAHFPIFFVLETCIDCCNLSMHVYKPLEPKREEDISKVEYLNPNMSTATLVDLLRPGAASPNRPNANDVGEQASHHSFHGLETPEGGWLNIAQFGYRLRCVKMVKKVQFLVAILDRTMPCHAGKTPRIVIAFRGTSRMSNVKKDSAFWNVRWSEAEERKESNSNAPNFTNNDQGDEVEPETPESPGLWERLDNYYNDDKEEPAVHAGFLSLWNSLRSDVRKKLRLAEREMDMEDTESGFEVVVTGHSLGGALAVLCAYHLSRWFKWRGSKSPRLIVYTFGQPRVGNVAFEKTYNKYVRRSFQVMNESDLVAAACGGVSGGTVVRLDRHGNYIAQPSEAEQFIRPTAGRGWSVNHHRLVNYAVALNAMANASNGECKIRVDQPYESRASSVRNVVQRTNEEEEDADSGSSGFSSPVVDNTV